MLFLQKAANRSQNESQRQCVEDARMQKTVARERRKKDLKEGKNGA